MLCQSKSKYIWTFPYNYIKSKEWSHRHFRKCTCYLLFNNGFELECSVPRKKIAGQVTFWVIVWARTMPLPKPLLIKIQWDRNGIIWFRKEKLTDFGFQLLFANYLICGCISNSSRKKKIKTSHHFWYNSDLLNTKPHYIDYLDQNYVLKYINRLQYF